MERLDGDLERCRGTGRVRTTMATASGGRDGLPFLLGLAETAFRVFHPLREPFVDDFRTIECRREEDAVMQSSSGDGGIVPTPLPTAA